MASCAIRISRCRAAARTAPLARGFLSGWTATGRRPPVFKLVTGVSTGALMAPFAFLGPEYDGALREFYTTVETRDIFAIGSLLVSLLRGDSLADTGPLASLIARHVDTEFLRKIADAHGRGRRLYIGTVDLDAQQFVVWNMGLIAVSGRPEAPELFRKVMLASASVPIAFPPVFFDVEAGGQRYDEMHVDGAVAARVFLNGGVFSHEVIRERAGRGVGQGGRVRDPQRPARWAAEPDAAVAARDRDPRPGGFQPLGRGRGSLPDLRRYAPRAGELPVGHDRRGRRSRRRRESSTRRRWPSSTRSATRLRSPGPSGRPIRRGCSGQRRRPEAARARGRWRS